MVCKNWYNIVFSGEIDRLLGNGGMAGVNTVQRIANAYLVGGTLLMKTLLSETK